MIGPQIVKKAWAVKEVMRRREVTVWEKKWCEEGQGIEEAEEFEVVDVTEGVEKLLKLWEWRRERRVLERPLERRSGGEDQGEFKGGYFA